MKFKIIDKNIRAKFPDRMIGSFAYKYLSDNKIKILICENSVDEDLLVAIIKKLFNEIIESQKVTVWETIYSVDKAESDGIFKVHLSCWANDGNRFSDTINCFVNEVGGVFINKYPSDSLEVYNNLIKNKNLIEV